MQPGSIDRLGHGSLRVVLRVMRAAMIPLALVFLGYLAWNTRVFLGDVIADANPHYLGLSMLFWIAAHLMSPVLGVVILGNEAVAPVYKIFFLVHARNLPARYLPGGIWHTVGRVADLRDRGFAPRRLAAFVFLENSVAATVTLGFGGAIVWCIGTSEQWQKISAICAIGGLAGLVLSRVIVNRWIAGPQNPLRFLQYVKSIVVVTIFWAFATAAFISYMHAFPLTSQSLAPSQIGGAYLLSWGFGFLAVFAPQGIGVFEVVLGALLSNVVPLAAMAVLATGFRLVVMCADLAVWLTSRFLPGTRLTVSV
jgi:glycosyltransferase 2 family protein